jgi:hypothetical protein
VGERRRVRHIPLKEAAAELGISKDAVRQRIRRGTLRSDKGVDGRVYVYLDPSTYDVHDDAPEERSEARDHDLVDELRDRVSYLERQVEEEREARRRADTLLARLMDRVPELEAPQEAADDPETVEESKDELGAERARREMAESTLREGMAEERRRREEAERERDELRRELHAHGRQQEAPEAAEEQQGRGQSQSAAGGAQEGARSEARPWWRRVFRG